MAATTSSFLFKPFLPHSNSSSLSSFESKLFGVRLCKPQLTRITLFVAAQSSITARYGGGSRFSGGGDSRGNQPSDSEQEPALDLSTIRSATVRLINEKQDMVGIVPKSQAIRMADDAELDLVVVSLDSDPPVVRMMDYRKFQYEQQKKKKEQQKKSSASRMDLKEIKMGVNIDQHDYTVRLKSAQKFLKEGDKVKVIVNLKGREKEFRNTAIQLIKRFQNDVGELATEEGKNFRDRSMIMVLVPNKAVLAQKPQQDPPSSTKETSSSSEEVTANSSSDEVTANSPSDEVTANSPSDEVTANSPSDEVTANSPSDEVTANSPSDEVTANLPSDEATIITTTTI